MWSHATGGSQASLSASSTDPDGTGASSDSITPTGGGATRRRKTCAQCASAPCGTEAMASARVRRSSEKDARHLHRRVTRPDLGLVQQVAVLDARAVPHEEEVRRASQVRQRAEQHQRQRQQAGPSGHH